MGQEYEPLNDFCTHLAFFLLKPESEPTVIFPRNRTWTFISNFSSKTQIKMKAYSVKVRLFLEDCKIKIVFFDIYYGKTKITLYNPLLLPNSASEYQLWQKKIKPNINIKFNF